MFILCINSENTPLFCYFMSIQCVFMFMLNIRAHMELTRTEIEKRCINNSKSYFFQKVDSKTKEQQFKWSVHPNSKTYISSRASGGSLAS